MNIPRNTRVPFLALITLLILSATTPAFAQARWKQMDRSETLSFTGGAEVDGLPSTPGGATAAASKAYVDAEISSVSSGLDPKESARAHVDTEDGILDGNSSITASSTAYDSDGGTSTRGQITATLAVSGTFTVDGVTMATGNRLLLSSEGGGTAEVMSVDTVADSAGSLNNDYWVFYTNASTAFYVWYDVAAGGTDPAPSPPAGVSFTGIEVDIITNETANDVATKTKTAIEASSAQVTVGTVTTNDLTLTNTFGGNVTDVAEGVGTGFTFATDTPGTGLGADANGIYSVTISGTSLTLDRTTDFDEDSEVTNGAYTLVSEGTSHGGHGHILTTSDPITIGGAGGTSQTWGKFSSLDLATATPSTVDAGDTGAVGTSARAAKEDHEHPVSTATAGTIQPDDSAAEGSSTSLARADHTHAIVAAVAGTIQPDDTAAEGSATSFSRSDHTHAIVAAAASASVDAGDTSTEGSSTSFARADHQHAVSTAAPSAAQTPDQTNAEGSATTLARSDHTHNIPAQTAVSVTTDNAEGTDSAFARSDHEHDSPQPTDANKQEASAATSGTNQTTGLTIASTPALASYVWVDVNGVVYRVGDGLDTADFYYSGDACTTPRATAAIVSGDVLCQGDALPFNLDTSDAISQHYLTFTNN